MELEIQVLVLRAAAGVVVRRAHLRAAGTRLRRGRPHRGAVGHASHARACSPAVACSWRLGVLLGYLGLRSVRHRPGAFADSLQQLAEDERRVGGGP